MKKLLTVLLAMVMVCMCCFGCSTPATTSTDSAASGEAAPAAAPAAESAPAAAKSDIKIGVVVKTLVGSGYAPDMVAAIEGAAAKYGAEVIVKSSAYSDFTDQVGFIEDLVTQQVDFIILEPGHETAAVSAVELAQEANIPVFCVDNGMASDIPKTVLGTGNELGAYQVCKYLCEAMGGKGKVVHIEGEAGNPNAAIRKDGLLRALEEYPEIELVVSQNGHWSEEGGLQVMENALQSHPDIGGVFAACDYSAFGAAEACKNAGVDPIIVGFDGFDEAIAAVNDGLIDATVVQYFTNMGAWAVELGMAYITYFDGIIANPYPEKIDTGTTVVTAENVAEFIK